MTTDEAFREYEETIDTISEEFNRAKEKAKATLNAHLNAIRATLHDELKVVRTIQQRKGR